MLPLYLPFAILHYFQICSVAIHTTIQSLAPLGTSTVLYNKVITPMLILFLVYFVFSFCILVILK